jgi:hypothetical protein
LTERQTPLVNPVSDEKQLWHDDRHAVSQHMPETQFVDPQSVDTWQASPSPREACARAAGATSTAASSAQTAPRLHRPAPGVLPTFMT